MTITAILEELDALQNSERDLFPEGIFPSYRYHSIFKFYKRADDNVYFTSFIIKTLRDLLSSLNESDHQLANKIVLAGESGLENYKSRFGDVTYNFYRSDGYFPNGLLLSKFKLFQPTDDADDTAIAYRAKSHSKEDAVKVKDHLIRLSNGQRNRWVKRSLPAYRKFKAYNTWIGTDQLYVDMDICVIANVLTFNGRYDLGISEQDIQSVKMIELAIQNGDYLKKKWSLNAWYPIDAVIFYQLSELMMLNYYKFSDETKKKLIADLRMCYNKNSSDMNGLLMDLAFWNLGVEHESKKVSLLKLDQVAIDKMTKKFSYGAIPLLHPFNGNLYQWLGSLKIFRLQYSCRAQNLMIIGQWLNQNAERLTKS